MSQQDQDFTDSPSLRGQASLSGVGGDEHRGENVPQAVWRQHESVKISGERIDRRRGRIRVMLYWLDDDEIVRLLCHAYSLRRVRAIDVCLMHFSSVLILALWRCD